MDDILATNFVALLLIGLSNLGQCLANPVSTYLASKAEVKAAFHLKQRAALRKLISQYHVECLTHVTGTFSLWRRNTQELCLSVDYWLHGRRLLWHFYFYAPNVVAYSSRLWTTDWVTCLKSVNLPYRFRF